MSITDKVRAVLILGGKKHVELAEHLGITSQSLSNKLNRGTYTASDMIKIAELTNSKIYFEFPDGQKIKLTEEDLK